MKQIIHYSVLSLLVCACLNTKAQEQSNKRYEHFKERNISKTYTAAGNSLDITNSFGKVQVVTWGSNEIKVEVHIEASSTNAGQAEKIFNAITVTDDKKGSTIYFKTEVGQNNNKGCKNCNNSMLIDYTIHLPASVKLTIDNSFGGVVIPDYNGELSVNSKFGSFNAGILNNIKNVNIEFGNAKIKNLNNLNAVFKFSSIELESLAGNNKLKFEFCNAVKIGLSNALTALDIKESYSTINLRPTINLSANFTINTSFGSVINRSNIDINRTDKPDEYGPDSEKEYEGKAGNGAIKIEIKSSFGKIIIGELKAGDIKEKKKNKNKEEIEI